MLNDALQTIGLLGGIAGVVGVEHWTRSPCAPVILGLVAFTLVISLWIVLLCLLKKISLWSLK